MCDLGGSGYCFYLVFLCISMLQQSVFVVGVYPVGVVLHVSLNLCAFYLTLSLVGSLVIHCNPLSASVVLVGHCGTFVVTFCL